MGRLSKRTTGVLAISDLATGLSHERYVVEVDKRNINFRVKALKASLQLRQESAAELNCLTLA